MFYSSFRGASKMRTRNPFLPALWWRHGFRARAKEARPGMTGDVIARSKSDEAIQIFCLLTGLLRFARNDGVKARFPHGEERIFARLEPQGLEFAAHPSRRRLSILHRSRRPRMARPARVPAAPQNEGHSWDIYFTLRPLKKPAFVVFCLMLAVSPCSAVFSVWSFL